MRSRALRHIVVTLALASVVLVRGASLTAMPLASAVTTVNIAALAVDNLGKGAGSCSTVNNSDNSLGGSQYNDSCTGDHGDAEFWCADFVKWVWENADSGTINVAGLDAGAASFYSYGSANGTLHTSASYQPHPGDAVVYDYDGHSYADHVGMVTAINTDGTITTVNGDWNGVFGYGEATFAKTSKVDTTILKSNEIAVGSKPSSMDGMTISAYVSPASTTPAPSISASTKPTGPGSAVPQPKWSVAAQLAPGPITSVSCNGVFCAAVGATGTIGHSHGYALTYQSGTWSKPVQLGTGDNYTVSCPAATFCVALTDTGYAYTLHADTWSTSTDVYPAANAQPSSTDVVDDLSCSNPVFCVAVTAMGNALTWNGSVWSPPRPIDLPGIEPVPFPGAFGHVSVSCPTQTYCLAGSGIDSTQAPSAVWNGSDWTVAPQTPLKTTIWNVSCASATFCMAAGGYHPVGDQSAVWDGRAWSSLAHPPGEGDALAFSQVSCPQNGFCVAVDGGSFVNGSGGWIAPASLEAAMSANCL
jgi:CHAP domain